MGTHPIFESDFDCLTEMENVANLSQSTDAGRLDCLKKLKEMQRQQKSDFHARVDDITSLKRKLNEFDRLLEQKNNQRDTKIQDLNLRISDLEANLKLLGELDDLNIKFDQVKKEIKDQFNLKSNMAIQIRLYQELFGIITNFNCGIGVYEGYFKTINGPLHFKVNSAQEFREKLKEARN